MSINIRCENPACGKPLRVMDELAGQPFKCPYCGQLVGVAAGAEKPELLDEERAAQEAIAEAEKVIAEAEAALAEAKAALADEAALAQEDPHEQTKAWASIVAYLVLFVLGTIAMSNDVPAGLLICGVGMGFCFVGAIRWNYVKYGGASAGLVPFAMAVMTAIFVIGSFGMFVFGWK
jgi:hypothetical protein